MFVVLNPFTLLSSINASADLACKPGFAARSESIKPLKLQLTATLRVLNRRLQTGQVFL
jgi:hypothetical protein